VGHGTRRDGAAAVVGVKGHLVGAIAGSAKVVAGAGAGGDLGVEAVEVGDAVGAEAGGDDRVVVGCGGTKVAAGQDAGAAKAGIDVLRTESQSGSRGIITSWPSSSSPPPSQPCSPIFLCLGSQRAQGGTYKTVGAEIVCLARLQVGEGVHALQGRRRRRRRRRRGGEDDHGGGGGQSRLSTVTSRHCER